MNLNEKRDCSIAKDLMYLYNEELLSEASKTFVEQHLEMCSSCKKFYIKLQESNEKKKGEYQRNENKFLSLLKKIRYEIFGFMCGVLMVIVLFTGLIIYEVNQNGKPVSEHYESVEDYGKQNYQGIAGLYIFPESNELNGTITDFYYDCEGQTLYQTYQIYLRCEYDKAEFQKEKDRLMNITDMATGKSTVYSENENALPCIYAMLYDEGFEYALIDNDRLVIYYIYLQGMDRRDIVFDESLLPNDYGQRGNFMETEREPYSIYRQETGTK